MNGFSGRCSKLWIVALLVAGLASVSGFGQNFDSQSLPGLISNYLRDQGLENFPEEYDTDSLSMFASNSAIWRG